MSTFRAFTYAMQFAAALGMVFHSFLIAWSLREELYWTAAANMGFGFVAFTIFMMQFEVRKKIDKIGDPWK